jgi:hypothetical protein
MRLWHEELIPLLQGNSYLGSIVNVVLCEVTVGVKSIEW